LRLEQAVRAQLMMAKRFLVWVLASVCLFVIANSASYFLRSDGFGLPGVRDGIVRVGCPFLMMERGGFVHREFVSMAAALGNLFVASIIAALVLGVVYCVKRKGGLDA
jgi:hypothetical protein